VQCKLERCTSNSHFSRRFYSDAAHPGSAARPAARSTINDINGYKSADCCFKLDSFHAVNAQHVSLPLVVSLLLSKTSTDVNSLPYAAM
jgi:hypothetical protein